MILLLATLASSGPLATAGHCSFWTTSTTGGTTVVTGPTNGFYLVVEAAVPPVRLYQETNTFAGLQRGDATRDDTCHGLITADLRIV